MGKDKKRKREHDAENDAEQPPPKAQHIDDGAEEHGEQKSDKANGSQRQLKSERKKKSAVQSKQSKTKNRGKPASATSIIQPSITQDELSAGKDFVSLTDKDSKDKKEKRRSPRAIRKERIQAKAQGPSVDGADSKDKSPAKTADARFICFVGNLPYSATSEQITSHFSKLQPKSVRLMTDKKTGKPKGFAFVEFDNYDKMKTCLKLYHHSIFDPDNEEGAKGTQDEAHRNTKSKARKINVELTAGGGGGKSTDRRDKIKAKNQKLDDERARDWEKKKQEEQESSKGNKFSRKSMPGSGANGEQVEQSSDMGRGDIHPSRMNRVRG